MSDTNDSDLIAALPLTAWIVPGTGLMIVPYKAAYEQIPAEERLRDLKEAIQGAKEQELAEDVAFVWPLGEGLTRTMTCSLKRWDGLLGTIGIDEVMTHLNVHFVW